MARSKPVKPGVILYAVLLGFLLLLLRVIEYRYLIIQSSTDIYIGLIALFFTVLGIWAGIRLTRKKPVVIEKKVPVVIEKADFNPALYQEKLKQFNISDREYEVLFLIANGHSNQEIADQLFISLSSVKTYTARLFSKLDVERRTQAIQKAKSIGILP